MPAAASSGQHFDIIIIGSGAGGATLAHRLAPAGKRILMLERGDFLPRERENWDPEAVFVNARYQAKETWYGSDGRSFHPGIHYWVGGNTKVYGAALFRLRREDFGEIRHHGGVSPAWPLAYEDFEPYYSEAEQLYQVHGEHGIDPTDPPASRQYPHPPVSHEPRIQELHDALVKLGHKPFPLPVGALLKERDGKPTHDSACVRCDAFDGFPCLVNGKADAQIICIEPTLKFANFTLLTNAYVERLETDAPGRSISRVQVLRDGAHESYSADIVVVACGALNSALLLLRSANDRHPNGLANSSGVVGRYYMRHNNSAFMAISRRPNPTKFQKTLALNDYYFGSKDWEFPLGHIQMLGKSHGPTIEAEAGIWADILPDMSFDTMARHAVDFWLTSEDLPDPNNRIMYSDGKVVLDLTENNMEGHHRLQRKLKEMLHATDFHPHVLPHSLYLGKDIPIGGTAHQAGTVRFGRDPKRSALDLNCKAHDLDNLYVVDAGFFVSIGAVNPSLTIIANALRVGDHLKQRLQ
ncbi:MAG TPA: GMC family oxidoreductase [Micropepsaceae bacterium]|nr:GMC family oxidoreductase [Micropepsaceae bacterium]